MFDSFYSLSDFNSLSEDVIALCSGWSAIILVVTFCLIIWDWRVSFYKYKSKFKVVERSINHLSKVSGQPQAISPQLGEIQSWSGKHLDGKWSNNLFYPKIDNGKFILLSYPSVLNSPVPRSPVSFAPTLLTALGILGTFWGIQSGLRDIGLNSIDNPEILIDSSTQLLAGMKLAFSTSLVGLGSAALMMLILAFRSEKGQAYRNKLRKKLDEIAVFHTPSHILSRMDVQSNRGQSNHLTAEAIGKAVGDAISKTLNSENSLIVQKLTTIQQRQDEQLQQLNANAIAHRKQVQDLVAPLAGAIAVANRAQLQDLVTPLAGAIAEANREQFKPLLTPLADEVRSLKELQEQQGNTVENLVNQLRTELIEPLVQRLDESANLTQEVSKNVQTLSQSLDGITESLSNSIGTIQKFQETTMSELQEFSRSMKDTLTQFQTDTKGVLETVAVEINKVVDKSIEGLDKQRQVFKDNADEVANKFQSIHRIIEDTKELTQEELRIFRNEYQTQLEDFLTAQKGELEGIIQKMGGVLVEAGESWRQIFNEITNKIGSSMSQINGTVSATSNLVSAVGIGDTERMAQYKELMRDIGQNASQVSRSYQKAANQFEQALGQFAGYLQQANESYCNNITKFDDSSTRIFNSMNQTSVELFNVSQYLVAAAKDVKTGNGRNG
ncbi:MAG: hypothetical protein ACP5D7_02995 [Limnospira sp.]